MAKKSKRKVSSGNGARSGVNAPVADPSATAQSVRTGSSAPTLRPLSTPYSSTGKRTPILTTEFNPDYTHTIYDLKRIAVLAGIFVAILVALSFFL